LLLTSVVCGDLGGSGRRAIGTGTGTGRGGCGDDSARDDVRDRVATGDVVPAWCARGSLLVRCGTAAGLTGAGGNGNRGMGAPTGGDGHTGAPHACMPGPPKAPPGTAGETGGGGAVGAAVEKERRTSSGRTGGPAPGCDMSTHNTHAGTHRGTQVQTCRHCRCRSTSVLQ
jgi:hypothetical protein